jgi:lipid II:glycine glycyltransferase (peptidoglycan interpeptide bridge formation enzyme)
MHYRIIRDAKLRGCTSYDLIGRDKPEQSGKWAGVTKFKEQFGGRAVEIAGSYDLIEKKTTYNIFKFVERLRRK